MRLATAGGARGLQGVAVRHALCEEFRAWLSAVTQIVLEPTIDISCAKYEYTGQSISVSEVVSHKCRLSVSGWFHGPSVARPTRHVETPLARSPHIPYDHEILYEWINLVYLDMDSQAQIQEEFEERSEILLKDFLKKEKYQLLCEALESKEIQWSSRGPANKRLGHPVCVGELRRWTHGHYTLVHDSQATEFALDLLFFCGCEDWDPEYGGFTSYIAKGEDEELLTVNPEDNCLALVYRDKETMKFVKYINHRSLARLNKHPDRRGFWDFSFVYYE
ncbi:hypothetical protein DUI87_14147 [Hirundo rustica rustica]|uniref:Oxoglutarate/iron-dependent oxygenase C-terminal degradation domain-containing protein n=1 Tax=Hirundo rustica rustica TaxID=333673 RepID=A0A3M0KDG2_HIRRU|nr:hypothetical protein DUI87_14147 [Hirundo rustica rustica]